MRKNHFLLEIIVFVSALASAQTTYNSSGNYKTVTTNEYEWSIGEMMSINTFSGSSFTATEGVLQPSNLLVTSLDVSTIPVNNLIQVYPNPTKDVVNITTENNLLDLVNYSIVDVQGSVIYENDNKMIQNKNQIKIDFNNIPKGQYFLKLEINNNGTKSFKNYTILKIN